MSQSSQKRVIFHGPETPKLDPQERPNIKSRRLVAKAAIRARGGDERHAHPPLLSDQMPGDKMVLSKLVGLGRLLHLTVPLQGPRRRAFALGYSSEQYALTGALSRLALDVTAEMSTGQDLT